jgi:rod shape-determining protein MreC
VSLRDGPFQDLKVPLTWTAAVAVVVSIVIGLALLLGDRRATVQGQAVETARDAFDRVSRPVSGVLDAPVRWVGDGVDGVKQYFFAVSENRRLKAEVANLTHWRDEAIALRHDNSRYEALLGLKTDPPIPMVSARVIADAHGPFAQTRLADAGTEAGVRIGNPVMTEYGLVGRVLGVATGVSRVLLLTDVSSRVPIMDDRTDSRGILTGDGTGSPSIDYLRGDQPVKAGDLILTSGDGGLFPRGLPVGVVYQAIDGNWRVRLDTDDGPVDNVRILLFHDVTQLARQPGLSQTTLPPLSAADAAQVQAQASAASASSAPPAGVASHPSHATAASGATPQAATAHAGAPAASAPASHAAAATPSPPAVTVTVAHPAGAPSATHAATPVAHPRPKHRPTPATSSAPAPDDTMPPT